MRKQGNDTNRPQVEGKKGKRRTLTVLGYALMIVFLLIVLPVVLPAIFGYHTYTVGSDATGNISKYGSVVYLKGVSNDSYVEGNKVTAAARWMYTMWMRTILRHRHLPSGRERLCHMSRSQEK